MFCDQSGAFYLGLGLCQGQPRARGPQPPQSGASQGMMCRVDAHIADTHRISPLRRCSVEFHDSWPVINPHCYVLQCKIRQLCPLPRTHTHIYLSQIKTSQPVFRLITLTFSKCQYESECESLAFLDVSFLSLQGSWTDEISNLNSTTSTVKRSNRVVSSWVEYCMTIQCLLAMARGLLQQRQEAFECKPRQPQRGCCNGGTISI